MKVLVLGGRGFIGSHVLLNLRRRGNIEDYSFDRRALELARSLLGDIKDREAVFDAVDHCDRWINLAGLLGTSELVERPEGAVAVNIQGALNVFDAAHRLGKPGVQITVGNHWMNNPYSITKSTAERFALMYNKELGTDIRVVRAMNVYGPGQKAKPVRKFFPNAVMAALRNQPITIYGNGDQVMDFVYVDDVAEVLVRLLLADKIDNSIVYECGTGDWITLRNTAQEIVDITGSKAGVEFTPMRPGEPPAAEVIMSETGWESLSEAIGYRRQDLTPRDQAFQHAIDWYRKNI